MPPSDPGSRPWANAQPALALVRPPNVHLRPPRLKFYELPYYLISTLVVSVVTSSVSCRAPAGPPRDAGGGARRIPQVGLEAGDALIVIVIVIVVVVVVVY